MRNLKQTLIWLKRFRYRCGYGVHSPFAFDFITNVIYEKTPYYAYRAIESRPREKDRKESGEQSEQVNRLLFRLVNRMQPATIVDAGKQNVASEYLQAAKKTARYVRVHSGDTSGLSDALQVGFLYIHCPEDPKFVENVLRYGLDHVDNNSMIVVGGIYHSSAMKNLWKQFIADNRVGITFDLYDLGILFFDKKKIKQHYTVNFY